MEKSIENRMVRSISGYGQGWAFSAKDFTRFGSRGGIDIALHRLVGKGTIRRVMRGIYDVPKHSSLLKQVLGPDMDAVAYALARKFGWRIQVTGASALNLQAQFNRELQTAAHQYLKSQLLPQIRALLGSTVHTDIADDNPNIIRIEYPAAFAAAYIKPEIHLEIGPLAIWTPNAAFQISPYCAEEFPELFAKPTCQVQVIRAERTFWEKATILHHEAFRPESTPQPARYSRHYYDLALMSKSSVKEVALSEPGLTLLKSVVASKERFYPRGWARYDLASPGSMRLAPPAHILPALKQDYREMQIMIYGNRPAFETIMDQILALEAEINSL